MMKNFGFILIFALFLSLASVAGCTQNNDEFEGIRKILPEKWTFEINKNNLQENAIAILNFSKNEKCTISSFAGNQDVNESKLSLVVYPTSKKEELKNSVLKEFYEITNPKKGQAIMPQKCIESVFVETKNYLIIQSCGLAYTYSCSGKEDLQPSLLEYFNQLK